MTNLDPQGPTIHKKQRKFKEGFKEPFRFGVAAMVTELDRFEAEWLSLRTCLRGFANLSKNLLILDVSNQMIF